MPKFYANQRGIAHLLLLLLVAAAVGVLIFLFATGKIKLPFGQKAPKVEIKTEYKNPFDKKTQFVNPFKQYKNPFVVNK